MPIALLLSPVSYKHVVLAIMTMLDLPKAVEAGVVFASVGVV
jgi:hypothetical protein